MSDREIIYYIGLECTYDPSNATTPFTWTRIDATENRDISLDDALANWVSDHDFSTKSSKLKVTLCFQKKNCAITGGYKKKLSTRLTFLIRK